MAVFLVDHLRHLILTRLVYLWAIFQLWHWMQRSLGPFSLWQRAFHSFFPCPWSWLSTPISALLDRVSHPLTSSVLMWAHMVAGPGILHPNHWLEGNQICCYMHSFWVILSRFRCNGFLTVAFGQYHGCLESQSGVVQECWLMTWW